jgi:Hint domain
MFLEGVLVPARHLVNRASIVKCAGMDDIEYFHLEFDRHVVILAEGAPAGSFVDDDSRMLFHNADEYRRLYPDERRGRYTEFCAPRVEAGYERDMLHRKLMARAERLSADGTAGATPARLGYLDRATRSAVEGWAFAGMGEGPVKLAILVNGAVVGQAVADRYRAGLGFGDGHCSFRFDLPRGLSADDSHRIEVRRESDWSPLHGGRVLLRPAPGA